MGGNLETNKVTNVTTVSTATRKTSIEDILAAHSVKEGSTVLETIESLKGFLEAIIPFINDRSLFKGNPPKDYVDSVLKQFMGLLCELSLFEPDRGSVEKDVTCLFQRIGGFQTLKSNLNGKSNWNEFINEGIRKRLDLYINKLKESLSLRSVQKAVLNVKLLKIKASLDAKKAELAKLDALLTGVSNVEVSDGEASDGDTGSNGSNSTYTSEDGIWGFGSGYTVSNSTSFPRITGRPFFANSMSPTMKALYAAKNAEESAAERAENKPTSFPGKTGRPFFAKSMSPTMKALYAAKNSEENAAKGTVESSLAEKTRNDLGFERGAYYKKHSMSGPFFQVVAMMLMPTSITGFLGLETNSLAV